MGLASSNRIFAAFQFDGIPPTAFWAFFAPDIIFIALLSAVRAYWKQSSLEYMILGAFGYASFYCCNATLLTFSGYLPTGLMALGLFYNVFLCFHAHLFRTASTGGKWNTTKTVVQIVCIWFLTLVIIPYMILDAFHTAPIQYDEWRMIVGAVLFLSFSFLGLLSAYFMVREGDGTPLPLDQTNRLVTAGPYGYVRNPMAIAGIGQGLSVALLIRYRS
jgi:protein-S-isoprenylcysteine O-methyltransferase Ste14